MKVPLCPVVEIPDEGAKAIDFFGRSVLVYKVDGRPRAIANVCLHLGGPLQCEGDKFVCPWHGAEYARADGRPPDGYTHAHRGWGVDLRLWRMSRGYWKAPTLCYT